MGNPQIFMPKLKFKAVEFFPGKWHVESQDGIPIYGQDDKPAIFDEDEALALVQRKRFGASEIGERE